MGQQDDAREQFLVPRYNILNRLSAYLSVCLHLRLFACPAVSIGHPIAFIPSHGHASGKLKNIWDSIPGEIYRKTVAIWAPGESKESVKQRNDMLAVTPL
jgi:hypothetical protein